MGDTGLCRGSGNRRARAQQALGSGRGLAWPGGPRLPRPPLQRQPGRVDKMRTPLASRLLPQRRSGKGLGARCTFALGLIDAPRALRAA